MQLNNLIPKTKSKKTMVVGRGGKRGKTSGRGGKGQTARAGNKRRPEVRDFIKRVPKLRGRGKNSFKSFYAKSFVINLAVIEEIFKAGDVVSPKTLAEKKAIVTFQGRLPDVKILGVGELSKKVSVEGVMVSKEAQAKIEKAGGSVVAIAKTPIKKGSAKVSTKVSAKS